MHYRIRPIADALGFNPLAWLRNTRRMQMAVAAFLSTRPAAGCAGPRVLAVITPWQGTSVPWYTLVLALLMSARGCRVAFVLDDLPFGDKPWRHAFVLRQLRAVLRSMQGHHALTVLSTQAVPSDADAAPGPQVHELAHLNTTWHLRGEMLEIGRKAYTDQCLAQISRADGPIRRMLGHGGHDVLLVPGGVFGTSGVWVAQARAQGLRVCSFDGGGKGVAIFATDGVASQLADIPSALSHLQATSTPDEYAFAHAAAAAEMAKRRKGVDTFASQIADAGSGDARYDGAALVALNSSWDAAALGLHTVFLDNTQWIVETVRHLLQHSSASVIVRQHPAERLPMCRTSDDYRALLHCHFGDEPRLHFIAAADSVNSYALLARVALVVAYTSTIGIEAAALGKPVVTPSRAYYAGLGFVWQAHDLPQYQALLEAGAAGELQVSAPMRADAYRCYYLTQCCNWFFSPFSPGTDLNHWSRLELAALQADANVQLVITALAEGIPLATLNHRQRWADAALAATAPVAAAMATR